MILLNMAIFQGKNTSILVVLQPKYIYFLAKFQAKKSIF